jgi:hypothetical protein
MGFSGPKLDESYRIVSPLFDPSLGDNLAEFERLLVNLDKGACEVVLNSHSLSSNVLSSAIFVKRAASQINVVVHALSILLSLPVLLEPNETVSSLSLGAGNSGRGFDLETNLRCAEFKLTDWKGGSEAIRQNRLFKDFYCLAEAPTNKKKQLFVVGINEPLRFLSGNRACGSVMSGNRKLWEEFQRSYGSVCRTVGQYYSLHKEEVEIQDLTQIVPGFRTLFVSELADQESTPRGKSTPSGV